MEQAEPGMLVVVLIFKQFTVSMPTRVWAEKS